MERNFNHIIENLDKIKFVAKIVRKAFEEIEQKESGEGEYFGYDLGGYCGRAAIQIYLACRKIGIKIKMVEGMGHAFNEYNNYIIDVTATQFGKYPKVYIKRYKCKYSNLPEFYQKVRPHLSTKSLCKSFWIKKSLVNSDKKCVNKHFPNNMEVTDVEIKRKQNKNY